MRASDAPRRDRVGDGRGEQSPDWKTLKLTTENDQIFAIHQKTTFHRCSFKELFFEALHFSTKLTGETLIIRSSVNETVCLKDQLLKFKSSLKSSFESVCKFYPQTSAENRLPKWLWKETCAWPSLPSSYFLPCCRPLWITTSWRVIRLANLNRSVKFSKLIFCLSASFSFQSS